jgi:flagellar hook-associated protein 3 FlgL
MARVPDVTTRRHLLDHIARHSNLLASRQLDIASGQRIRKPSDGLFETSRAMAVMSEKREASSFASATDSTQFLAATLENGVSGVLDLVSKARAVGVRAASDPSDVGTEALAEEIDAALEELLEVANRRAVGSYVFAGEAATTQPYTATRDAEGNITSVSAAPGIDEPLVRLVGRAQVEVPITGPGVFTEGGDAFQTLIDLREAVLAGDHDAIQAGIDGLEAIEGHVSNRLAALGTFRNRVDEAIVRLEDESVALEQERSRAMDTDMADAMVQLSSEEFFYQAALSMSARVSNLSILNFL